MEPGKWKGIYLEEPEDDGRLIRVLMKIFRPDGTVWSPQHEFKFETRLRDRLKDQDGVTADQALDLIVRKQIRDLADSERATERLTATALTGFKDREIDEADEVVPP